LYAGKSVFADGNVRYEMSILSRGPTSKLQRLLFLAGERWIDVTTNQDAGPKKGLSERDRKSSRPALGGGGGARAHPGRQGSIGTTVLEAYKT